MRFVVNLELHMTPQNDNLHSQWEWSKPMPNSNSDEEQKLLAEVIKVQAETELIKANTELMINRIRCLTIRLRSTSRVERNFRGQSCN